MSEPTPMTPRTTPDAYHLLSMESNRDYLVYSPREIATVLRHAQQKKAWLAAYAGAGQYALLTMVLFVDAKTGEVLLDCAADDAANRTVLSAAELTFVTRIDGVHIQFTANRIELVTYEGTRAFRIRLPEVMLRQQRRDNYRISVPAREGVTARIQFRNGNTILAQVMDLSAGGLRLAGSAELLLEKGMQYQGCEIRLPGNGTLNVTLQVQHADMVTLSSGAQKKYFGCKFVDLPADLETRLQRYIMELERKTRLD